MLVKFWEKINRFVFYIKIDLKRTPKFKDSHEDEFMLNYLNNYFLILEFLCRKYECPTYVPVQKILESVYVKSFYTKRRRREVKQLYRAYRESVYLKNDSFLTGILFNVFVFGRFSNEYPYYNSPEENSKKMYEVLSIISFHYALLKIRTAPKLFIEDAGEIKLLTNDKIAHEVKEYGREVMEHVHFLKLTELKDFAFFLRNYPSTRPKKESVLIEMTVTQCYLFSKGLHSYFYHKSKPSKKEMRQLARVNDPNLDDEEENDDPEIQE